MYANGKGVPQDYEEAAKWIRKAADQGDSSAQTFLGLMYDEGYGVPQNYKEAKKWFSKAADQGDSGGQIFLGSCTQRDMAFHRTTSKLTSGSILQVQMAIRMQSRIVILSPSK